jgi:hypothetical protein
MAEDTIIEPSFEEFMKELSKYPKIRTQDFQGNTLNSKSTVN